MLPGATAGAAERRPAAPQRPTYDDYYPYGTAPPESCDRHGVPGIPGIKPPRARNKGAIPPARASKRLAHLTQTCMSPAVPPGCFALATAEGTTAEGGRIVAQTGGGSEVNVREA